MPRVYIPAPLRSLADGKETIDVEGDTVGEALADLERRCPGFHERLLSGEKLRAGLSVVVDGVVASQGLRQSLSSDSEVHFLPAIGGG